MILKMTTQEFSKLDVKGLKKVFSEVLGHKVNEIIYGSMTNDKWGLYRIRHNKYAYSRIKVDPTEDGLTELTFYNFSTKEYQPEP